MQSKQLVLFDMDNTLVNADTLELWHEFLYQKGVLSAPEKKQCMLFQADYIAGKLDVKASYQFGLALLKRITVTERLQWRSEFFTRHIIPQISHSGLKLIQEYKQQPNTLVILITATISFIAAPVADYAGVHALIASQEEMIADHYTGQLVGEACLGKGKLLHFKRWLQENNIKPQSSIFYSDSINDLPLLDWVDRPIIVDPDPLLKDIARQRQWQLISLKNSPVQ